MRSRSVVKRKTLDVDRTDFRICHVEFAVSVWGAAPRPNLLSFEFLPNRLQSHRGPQKLTSPKSGAVIGGATLAGTVRTFRSMHSPDICRHRAIDPIRVTPARQSTTHSSGRQVRVHGLVQHSSPCNRYKAGQISRRRRSMPRWWAPSRAATSLRPTARRMVGFASRSCMGSTSNTAGCWSTALHSASAVSMPALHLPLRRPSAEFVPLTQPALCWRGVQHC